MGFIDCPGCGRKLSVHRDACPFCGRRLTDPITRLKADLARIDAQWERDRKEFVRDYGGSERVLKKRDALVAGAVPIVLGVLLVLFIWQVMIRHFGWI